MIERNKFEEICRECERRLYWIGCIGEGCHDSRRYKKDHCDEQSRKFPAEQTILSWRDR